MPPRSGWTAARSARDRVAWVVGGDGAEHGTGVSSFNNSQRSNTLSVSSIVAGVGVGLGVAGSGLACSSTTPAACSRSM